MSVDFLLTSLIVVVIPGTGVIYTVSVAMSRGGRTGVIAAVGCTLGIVPHLIAAVFGLSAFLHAGALAFRILKYSGIAYLIFLSYSMIRSHSTTALDGRQPRERAAGAVVLRGILLNLLNPKLTLFFFAFLPQFLSSQASLPSLFGLGVVFMAMTFVVFAGYAGLAGKLGAAFASSTRIRRRIERSMGLLLAGFAVKLALTDV